MVAEEQGRSVVNLHIVRVHFHIRAESAAAAQEIDGCECACVDNEDEIETITPEQEVEYFKTEGD